MLNVRESLDCEAGRLVLWKWPHAPPPEVPQRTLREAGEGLGPVGGILEHSSKQNLLGRGFLREWSCVINFRDSERINTFVDRGKSIEISPSL